MAMAVFLSGARGSGKSTLCLYLAEKLESVGGIICPGIFDACGTKVGFNSLCLQSGESWQLGTVKPNFGDAGGRKRQTASGAQTGKYVFSESGIQRSIDCIRGSLRVAGGITIIDEIGPLELVNGEGFAPILKLLEGAGDLLIVVRPEFIETMLTYIECHECNRFDLTVSNRDILGDQIVSFFKAPR